MNTPEPANQPKVGFPGQTRRPATQLGDLRQLLDRLEKTVAGLAKSTPEQALQIPILLDQAMGSMEKLNQVGANIEGQKAQFSSITLQLKKKASLFVRRVGGTAALQKTRQSHQLQAETWWWHLDEVVASERKSVLRRWLRNLGIVAVILLAAILIYQRFFAPDPALRSTILHQQNAQDYLIEGDFENALVETNVALTYSPDSADLLIFKGVLLEKLEQPDAAAESFDEAKKFVPEEYQFNTQRALYYLMLEEPEKVLSECDIAIELNPNAALCYLQQGQAYELLGDIASAIERMNLADEAAQRLGNAQLQAIIRVNLSNVMQKLPAAPTPQIEE